MPKMQAKCELYLEFSLLNANKNENLLILEGNSYCRLKRSGKGPLCQVSSERLSPEIDILIRSPIGKLTKPEVA